MASSTIAWMVRVRNVVWYAMPYHAIPYCHNITSIVWWERSVVVTPTLGNSLLSNRIRMFVTDTD